MKNRRGKELCSLSASLAVHLFLHLQPLGLFAGLNSLRKKIKQRQECSPVLAALLWLRLGALALGEQDSIFNLGGKCLCQRMGIVVRVASR